MATGRICSPREFSFEDLHRFTNGFSTENFIGETQFGKVYHGKISKDQDGTEAQEVTVKIWVDYEEYNVEPEEKNVRVKEEAKLLQQQNLTSHPNMVKLIGHCSKGEQLGIVYDLKALDTVYNLVCEESFTWKQRIKVAVEFACLVDFLHNDKNSSMGYLVRNISPAHIMLDQDFSPRLFDFSMLSGGILPDRTNIEDEEQWGYYGYFDPYHAFPGTWTEECDVFSFGCVLIGLVCKRVYSKKGLSLNDDIELYDWACRTYSPTYNPLKGFGRSKCSLVHESLKADEGFYPSDGIKMTRLLMRCVDETRAYRPTMKEVVQYLLKLRVVRQYGDALGLKQILHGRSRWYADALGAKQMLRGHILNILPLCR